MKVGIIQSNYIPWQGYFDFIDDVELFVFHDDLQYTKGDWRNRNRIKTPEGTQWLTVPVKHSRVDQQIDQTPTDDSQGWRQKHLRRLEATYRQAPHFSSYIQAFADIVNQSWPNLSTLNVALSHWTMACLGIHTPTRVSGQLHANGSKSEKIIDIMDKVGGSTYLSGPAAESYLDLELFRQRGIQVEFKTYDYQPYPQLWGPFVSGVTVLDLLFNTGPDAQRYLKSLTPNRSSIFRGNVNADSKAS